MDCPLPSPSAPVLSAGLRAEDPSPVVGIVPIKAGWHFFFRPRPMRDCALRMWLAGPTDSSNLEDRDFGHRQDQRQNQTHNHRGDRVFPLVTYLRESAAQSQKTGAARTGSLWRMPRVRALCAPSGKWARGLSKDGSVGLGGRRLWEGGILGSVVWCAPKRGSPANLSSGLSLCGTGPTNWLCGALGEIGGGRPASKSIAPYR